jgi:transposase-like protein
MMKTEEEAKYELHEQIFELYDRGISIENISERLDTSIYYINAVFNSAQKESLG